MSDSLNAPTPSPSLEGRGDIGDIPDFADLALDPEIAALLDFEPVPRKRNVEGGWTPELQREFIARLAVVGSPGRVCEEMGKTLTGMMKLYRSPLAASFRSAWHGAVELAKRRQAERVCAEYVSPGAMPPSLDHRFKSSAPRFRGEGDHPEGGGGAGQLMNELGEWEDEESIARRVDEARDNVSRKLINARRLYLQEIASSPGKRAAFEILTELPIDWDKAGRLEPQPDEPWRKPNMREPDMLLTAEDGWLGDVAHGPDKKAELRQALDEYRAEEGLPPVDWGEPAPHRNGDDGAD
jgi:hypothetical protein